MAAWQQPIQAGRPFTAAAPRATAETMIVRPRQCSCPGRQPAQSFLGATPVEHSVKFRQHSSAQILSGDDVAEAVRISWVGEILTCPGADNTIRWRPGERLHHLFEDVCLQLERDGLVDHLAVSTNTMNLSYGELDRRANQLARYLVSQGVEPSERIGLVFDRSAWTYIALLAVMKVRAAYVPLDIGFPKDRLSFIAEDAGIRRILTISGFREKLQGIPAELICLDEEQRPIEAEDGSPLDAPRETIPPDELCYIIYTSGSTGKPKGVAVAHSSICNFVRVAADIYGLMREDRVYQGMTIAFDFSVEEILVPLMSGATLIPCPPGGNLLGKDLSDFLKQREVTALCCVPTLLATIEDELPKLRFLLVSGEACPHNLVARWHSPARTFLNVYGPTEATVTATWTILHPDKPVTIGVPLPTYSVVILDESEAKALPRGATGEIGIAGIGLAEGYVNRPDLTHKAFIPDFLNIEGNLSRRIYRTGDLGRINGHGEIEYLGRIDTQVKIRGYRIELSEIESVIMTVPGIAQAVVNIYESAPGAVELVAYYTLRHDVERLEQDDIYSAIRDQLPSYMLPSFFEQVSILPVLPSGKADRKNLPAPMGPRYHPRGTCFVPPQNDLERDIAAILGEFLNLDQVSVEDHFFNDLGANSLLMARVCATIREKLAYSDVSMRDMYLHPSVREFSSFLLTRAPQEQPSARTETAHVASDAEYYACGFLQALFYCAYVSAVGLLFIESLPWIVAATDTFDAYLRSALLGTGLFLTMAILPVILKWLLVGKWTRERIPVWSLRYVRFWIVKQLVRLNPMVLFAGTPLYNVYLRLLGARIGRNVAIFSASVPVCTDLLSIGDGTIVRKDAFLAGYRAQSGYIETGAISIGRNAFIGEATVLDIETTVEDRAQLGHASSLHKDQIIPAGKRFHGSPAQMTDVDYCSVEARTCSATRRIAFSALQVLLLVGISLPLPIFVGEYLFSQFVSGPENEFSTLVSSGIAERSFHLDLVVFAFTTFVGLLLGGLVVIVTVPRLLNRFVRADETHVLYGFHFLLFRGIYRLSNSRWFNEIFGDSSYIIYYLKVIGYDLSLSDQTGSNFGLVQKHDTPFLCQVGRGTLVSDGLSMINAQMSSTSFRLSKVSIGANSFLGNKIFYPSGASVGDNCLLATKVMVPIDGQIRRDVGLLGSPCFEIPRSVLRDKRFDHYKDGAILKDRLFRKLMSNTVTIGLYLLAHCVHFYLMILLFVALYSQYERIGDLYLPAFVLAAPILSVAYFILVERASVGFSRLQPQFCSIYDDYFWSHERYWKLSDTDYIALFNGTPFKNLLWRLLGVKLGKKLFDDGCTMTEKTLVSIGDYCTLGEMSILQSHSLEDGTFKSDHIRIGNGCTIGGNAFVHYGVSMNDNVVLEPDSFLMKGEILARNTTWRGNPARQI
jgi:non-ribosomal peptide synthetase-like protein